MLRTALAILALAAIAAARAADPGSEASKSYRIETGDSTHEAKVGQKGRIVLAFQPLQKVHVHPQAPLKITLQSGQGLRLEKAQLGHQDAVDPRAEAPRFEVPFTATAAGKQEAKALFDFFVCSDTWCVKQTREVAVAVNVR